MGVHTGLCEEEDRLWDPEVLQEEARPPSLDLILGVSFDHVDQALWDLQVRGVLCMHHLPCLQGGGAPGGRQGEGPWDGGEEGQVGGSQEEEEAEGPSLLEEEQVS